MLKINIVDILVGILSFVIVLVTSLTKPIAFINLVYLLCLLLLYFVSLRRVILQYRNHEHISDAERSKVVLALGAFLAFTELIQATVSFNANNYVGGLIQASLALVFVVLATNGRLDYSGFKSVHLDLHGPSNMTAW